MKKYAKWLLCLMMSVVACMAQNVPPRPAPQPAGVLPVRPNAPQPARPATPQTPTLAEDDSPNALNFVDTPVDIVLTDYAQRTQRTLLISPTLPRPNITLRSTLGAELTEEDYLMAVEIILNYNGIALELEGEKFLKVFPSAELRKTDKDIDFGPANGEDGAPGRYDGTGFVSRMIELKHIDINEAKAVVDGFTRQGAMVQLFERTKSILITDSAGNVNRILEILAFIDKPLVNREEPHIVQIKFAKAADIKARLQEIVDMSQADAAAAARRTAPIPNAAGAPGITPRPLPAGVTVPPRPGANPTTPVSNEALETLIQDAERGIIRGKVQMVSDERTNILIIMTSKENMTFFERVIEVLDIETAPDVNTEFFRLEHAVAKDVAALLNDLIGNDARRTTDAARSPATAGAASGTPASANFADFAASRRNASVVSDEAASRVGQLDRERIKIIADERANALMIMASRGDMETLKSVIKQVDIKLSQVIIETVLVELSFRDTLDTGVNWVQRAVSRGPNDQYILGVQGGGNLTPVNLTSGAVGAGGAGVSSYLTFANLDFDVIASALKTDSRSRIMSSPIIMTQDNKEAVIEATTREYFSKGSTYYYDSNNNRTSTSNVDREEVGMTLKVTPRINKNGHVVLTIEQKIDKITSWRTIDEEEWPIVSSRRMGADVAVQNGETIVLGGLAENQLTDVRSKIPILGDIPLLGWFFRSTKKEEVRNEIVVFLTPRVIDDNAEAEAEARKRKAYLDTQGIWRADWSDSKLADPLSERDARLNAERMGLTVVTVNGETNAVLPSLKSTKPVRRRR